MKKLRFLPIATIIGAIAFLSSCSTPNSNPPPSSAAKLDFKKDFHAQYDIFIVDTADKNGNNADKILGSSKISVSEIIVDTGLTYPPIGVNSKNNVSRVVTFMTAPTPNDTNYFYQDPNGDLYRYNFGFSILNQFVPLTQAIGGNVDVGWVLAAKITSAEGTTWLAKQAYDTVISFNLQINLQSNGTMMADTTFLIGTETIKARHARNSVTATAGSGSEFGTVIIDSYYSTDINAVVEDFFRHVTLSGQLVNEQAQGKFKIMTSHQ